MECVNQHLFNSSKKETSSIKERQAQHRYTEIYRKIQNTCQLSTYVAPRAPNRGEYTCSIGRYKN
jgi:hypothetical protein